jgi:transcriptional regulator with XRE-family HTH domain
LETKLVIIFQLLMARRHIDNLVFIIYAQAHKDCLFLESMSPFSHFLHELRLQHQIRQSELAELLGYEQSYISALEVGIKGPPTDEFVKKLITTMALSPSAQLELLEAIAASDRKLALPADSPQSVYWMLKRLRDQLDNLHPLQVKMIQDALAMRSSLVEPSPEPVRRLKRRRREEATM